MRLLTHPIVWVTLLLSLFAFQVGSFMVLHSNTYDEVTYIGSGLRYVTAGNLDMDITEHPPLMKYAIGLALTPYFKKCWSPTAINNSYRTGFDALYRSGTNPRILLAVARLPTLLLALLLGGFIYLWASRWFGPFGDMLALTVYAFEPTLIAHSGQATFDLPMTTFLFIATYFMVLYMETASVRYLLVCGLFLGFAIATKVTAFAAAVWLPLILAFGDKPPVLFNKPIRWRTIGHLAVGMIGVPFLVLVVVYQFVELDRFFVMFFHRFAEVTAGSAGTPNYFHGIIREGGWRSFYVKAFLIKTSIPFLFLIALGFLGARSRKLWVLIIPVVVVFSFASLSSIQQGIRYVLPAFPFLCLWVGCIVDVPLKWARVVAGGLVMWCFVEAVMIFPSYLAYFNQFVGGPANGYKWLVDSNLDWGQDFPALGLLLKNHGNPEVMVAAFSTADVGYFIGPHQNILPDPNIQTSVEGHINSLAPKVEFLVVSATFLQGLWLTDPRLFEWLRGREPLAKVGYSLFVYDVTHDAFSQRNVGLIYQRLRRDALVARQFRRAQDLMLDKSPI